MSDIFDWKMRKDFPYANKPYRYFQDKLKALIEDPENISIHNIRELIDLLSSYLGVPTPKIEVLNEEEWPKNLGEETYACYDSSKKSICLREKGLPAKLPLLGCPEKISPFDLFTSLHEYFHHLHHENNSGAIAHIMWGWYLNLIEANPNQSIVDGHYMAKERIDFMKRKIGEKIQELQTRYASKKKKRRNSS